jgi:hypothetical protein
LDVFLVPDPLIVLQTLDNPSEIPVKHSEPEEYLFKGQEVDEDGADFSVES